MGAIKYVSIRSLVPTGVAVTGQDIAADDITNDFQSTTTDLSVFTLGRFINVSNFTTYSNPELVNGWHYVNAAPTVNALSTSSDLPTVAAGDQVTITEYFHRYGMTQALSVDFTQLTHTRQAQVEEAVSYGGLRQGLLHRVDKGYDVQVIIKDDDKIFWEEFFDSVAAKEPFSIDPMGTVGTEDSPEICVLDNDPTYQRLGNFKVLRKWRINFKVMTL